MSDVSLITDAAEATLYSPACAPARAGAAYQPAGNGVPPQAAASTPSEDLGLIRLAVRAVRIPPGCVIDRDDLVQELWMGLGSIRAAWDPNGGASRMTWVWTKLIYRAIDIVREVTHRGRSSVLMKSETDSGRIEGEALFTRMAAPARCGDGIVAAELRAAVRRHCTPREAEMIDRYYWGHEDQAAIAATCGCTFSNVSFRIGRGVMKLRRRLRREDWV